MTTFCIAFYESYLSMASLFPLCVLSLFSVTFFPVLFVCECTFMKWPWMEIPESIGGTPVSAETEPVWTSLATSAATAIQASKWDPLETARKSLNSLLTLFVQGRSPTPQPFFSRPLFVCKFICQGSTEVFKTLASVLDISYSANAYICTVHPRLTQLLRPIPWTQ